MKEFHLDDDEHIVAVTLQSGWLIDQMGFKSNKGKRYGPFGGDGGGIRDVATPNKDTSPVLACLKGTIGYSQGGKLISTLQFLWRYYE